MICSPTWYHRLMPVVLTIFGGMVNGQDGEYEFAFEAFRQHYHRVTNELVDRYGEDPTPMWLSSWDLNSETYPFDFSRPDSIPCRVYLDRYIDAPAGSTLYWSLPDLSAVVHLSRVIKDPDLLRAAKDFAATYLDRCTNKDGVILWGNHYYYHVIMDTVVKFGSNDHPRAVNMA